MDALKILGGLLGNNAAGGNVLGSILKGAAGGGAPQQQSSGGLGGLGGLGSLLGAGSRSGGGGSNILGSIVKAAIAKKMAGALGGGGGGGGLLGSIFGGGEKEAEAEVQQLPQQQVQDQATLLIRAMCNAAKSDGQIDQQEQENIVKRMGDLDQAEIDFLRNEFASPLDLDGFVRTVPQDLAPQVYAFSVMSVKVDTRQEANYLNQLAQGLRLDQQTVGQIHQQLGVA